MNRILRKGPSGHYHRDQWVLFGFVQERPAHNKAYFIQYLWEHTKQTEFGGYYNEGVLRDHMTTAAKDDVKDIDADLDKQLACMDTVKIGPLTATFRRSRTGSHFTHVDVRHAGLSETRTIKSDFAANWESGELQKQIKDAMMELAAIGPAPGRHDTPVAPKPPIAEKEAKPPVTTFEAVECADRPQDEATALIRPPATAEQKRRIQEMYRCDDINIDKDAVVSEAEHGVWVSGWLWLPDEEPIEDTAEAVAAGTS